MYALCLKYFTILVNKLLLLVTVFFISCSKDTYEDLGKESNNSKYKLTVLNSKELKKQSKLFKKIDGLSTVSKLKSTEKKVTSKIYNFSIDTKKVNLIEVDNIKTYTFKVNRSTDNGLLENLHKLQICLTVITQLNYFNII